MVNSSGPCGIVLAAGLSRRLGRNKLLLPLGPKPILVWSVENALAAALDEVIVVVGHQHEIVEEAIRHLPVRIAHNSDYETGQSTSLKTGVREAPPNCECFIFFLGDQPLIGPEIVTHLLRRYRQDHPLFVTPTCNGKKGNPVLVNADLRQELTALTGDTGARVILKRHSGQTATVEVDDPAIGMDVDREEDYEACLKIFQIQSAPPSP